MQNLKVAIVGCGDVAGGYDEKSNDDGIYTHAKAYQSCGVPITAAVEPNPERLREFASYWKVQSGYENLLPILEKSKFDIISICTPDPTHFPIIKEILLTCPPKIIWAEKPLATSSKDAYELVNLAREKKVGMRVSYQRRWEPGHAKMRSLISEGKLGEITAATAYYVKGLIHIGTTAIDTIRYLIGEVEDSWLVPPSERVRGSYPNDTSDGIVMRLGNGCQAVVLGVDGNQYAYSLFEIDILGSKGRIRITNSGDVCEIYEIVQYSHYEGFYELKAKERFETKMKYSMKFGLESILFSLESGKWEDISEGLNAARNIEIASESRALGGKR